MSAPSRSAALGAGAAAGPSTSSRQRWALAKESYTADPKYKKYAQQVDRCLNSFDNVQEWADCIAFIKQLLKTLQSYMQLKEIPRKLIVAKRLSQCLNPALPTGVHQRALEVYAHIFAVVGSEGLKADLALWSSGLFPFFEYAATSVKPALLNLYDTYYIPLQAALRPAMKSFILCLLPGLEEETGEFFETVLGLLDKLSGTVSPAFFLQNIWLIVLTSPSARGNALNFLARRLPRLNSDEDITPVVGQDTGLMIRAFAAALEDDNILVRRLALDILVQSIRPDSVTFKKANREDRGILMQAASSVVLRRDLSLNRRLYTWLLGSDEKSENQIQYFRAHSLDLLAETLKDEMTHPTPGYSPSRPFKIYISLQDKWEAGGPLTDVLALDAFKALRASISSEEPHTEDMVMTASAFYEAVEPLSLWKYVFSAVVADVTGQSSHVEAIRLARFLLSTFNHDEETIAACLPVFFAGIADLVKTLASSTNSTVSAEIIREVFLLFETILKQMPHDGSSARPVPQGSTGDDQELSPSPFVFACDFFGASHPGSPVTSRRSSTAPVVTVFEDLVAISLGYAQVVTRSQDAPLAALEAYDKVLVLLTSVLDALRVSGANHVKVEWDPQKLVSVVLDVLRLEKVPFTVIDHSITLAEALHRNGSIEPKCNLEKRSTLLIMVNKLFKYLRPNLTGYHLRTVNLIWSLQALHNEPHIESILAESLAKGAWYEMQGDYDAFGALWRLTEDSLLPGFRLKVPMFIVLDTLKSPDVNVRRVGETWMRCYMKSYLRVLDPVLHDLLDARIKWTPTTFQLNGKQLQGFVYEHPVDQRYMSHLLEILLSVVRFGGQGFVKTVRGTLVQRSLAPQFKQRADEFISGRPDASYLDCLVELTLRLLQTEPKGRWSSTMGPMNSVIQALAVDLLQMLVSRGEMDDISLEMIQAAVISKLYFSIHTGRLDLQNKLLHLLHSVVSASSTLYPQTSKAVGASPAISQIRSSSPLQDSTRPEKTANPLLAQTLVDGISVPSNRPLVQHWLDFILMTIPQFHDTLRTTIGPLIDCICRRLRVALADVSQALAAGHMGIEDKALSVTDAELFMYLNALERLVMLSLSNRTSPAQQEDDGIPPEKGAPESTGLFGYVSTVFGTEETGYTPDEQLTSRSQGYRALHQSVRVLFAFWTTLAWANPLSPGSMDESLAMIYSKTRLRTRRVLEHLYRAHASEVLEIVTQAWDTDFQGSFESRSAAFELVDVLSENAQMVVHTLCDSITCRITGAPVRSRRQAVNPALSEDVLFTFLEAYLQQLEGPLAIQVWPTFLQMTKEIAGNWREYRLQVYPTLRCITVLAEKIAQSSALEDRRLRRDLQDSYGKLLDASISLAGRDPGPWMRRGGKDSLAVNGRSSPAPKSMPDLRLDDKSAASSPVDNEAHKALTVQIIHYIARNAVPRLRKLLVDADKILPVCQNITYYIVNPAMKGKTKPMDIDGHIVEIIQEMTRLPAAIKAWRGVVSDTLNDARVFNSTPEAGVSWKPIVAALVDTDKSAFPELLGKVTTAPSANIFTNREYEMLLQSLSLRRLSYVLLTSEKNHFLTQLPSVIEKLVDILKNVPSPVVQSDVYLCMRVLVCRLSPHNLTSFWPVILTDLYRLFDSLTTELPVDGAEELPLILAASKFLDLLLVLQTDEFQIHQWVFITDTVDAVYRPESWSPEALLDHLADVVANSQAGAATAQSSPAPLPPTRSPMIAETGRMRRPMLNYLHNIESVRDLLPFFSHVSIASYESIYGSDGSVDWDAIESGILEDMFDGRQPS